MSIGSYIQGALGWGQDEEELKNKLMIQYQDDPKFLGKIRGDSIGQDGKLVQGTWNTGLFDTMKSTEQSRSLAKRQKVFDIAAKGGAQHGGPSIGDIGQKMPYGDTAMFNPKAMPPRYLPGTKPREEDELIPPGFAQFPYRMYS